MIELFSFIFALQFVFISAIILYIKLWYIDCILYNGFYLHDAMLARVFEAATHLSVCPSRAGIVSERKKASVTISSPSGSPTILVFWRQISSQNSKGFPLPRALASKKGGVGKFSDFLALSINISKTVADTAKVTISDY